MTDKNPTVSVIIPTYNRAHLLERSIRSVLNQTYQDFEIIVIDDGSRDNTEEVLRNLGSEKIRYLRHEINKGAAAARNTGIKAAKGNYIAFQDSDDEWLPKKLEKQMQVFETAPADVGVVYTGFNRIKGDLISYVPFAWVTKKEGDILLQLIKGNFIGTPSILVRKKNIFEVGFFDENLPRMQDWDFVLTLSKYYKFKVIDQPLLIAYHTATSITTDNDAFIFAFKYIFEKHFNDFKIDKHLCAAHAFRIGSLLCQRGRLKEGRKYYIKSLKLQPFNIKRILATIVSYFGENIYKKVWYNYRYIKYILFKPKVI